MTSRKTAAKETISERVWLRSLCYEYYFFIHIESTTNYQNKSIFFSFLTFGQRMRKRLLGPPVDIHCFLQHLNNPIFILSFFRVGIFFVGARCAPNTFDGERCLYAALTDRIKNILRSYKAITPECMRRDSYREFFRRY